MPPPPPPPFGRPVQPYGTPYPYGGPPSPPPGNSRVGLVLGIVGGGVALLMVIALAVVVWVRAGSAFHEAGYALTLPETLVGGRFELVEDLSDSGGRQELAEDADTWSVQVTDVVTGRYAPGGDQGEGMLMLTGLYGELRSPGVAREGLLEGVGETDGVTVEVEAEEFAQSGSPTVGCAVLSHGDLGATVVYPVCAWADDNTAALVFVLTEKTAEQDPFDVDLSFYARLTLRVRSEAVRASAGA